MGRLSRTRSKSKYLSQSVRDSWTSLRGRLMGSFLLNRYVDLYTKHNKVRAVFYVKICTTVNIINSAAGADVVPNVVSIDVLISFY